MGACDTFQQKWQSDRLELFLSAADGRCVWSHRLALPRGALKTLFARMDEPDIYKARQKAQSRPPAGAQRWAQVREILMRLAKTNPRPNQNLAGAGTPGRRLLKASNQRF